MIFLSCSRFPRLIGLILKMHCATALSGLHGALSAPPYRWGGESVRSGFDCSGLTMTVYRLNGLELPRNSRSQFRVGAHTSRQALEPGDLVFFATGKKGRVSHVGVYSGKGQFIHASGQGKKIQTASLDNRYFPKTLCGCQTLFLALVWSFSNTDAAGNKIEQTVKPVVPGCGGQIKIFVQGCPI